MFIRLTSKDAPLMGPFHTLISLKVKRWHNSNLQRENVKCSEQWFKNTFTRLFISLLATHYGRIAILVHLGLALCLEPYTALASFSPSSVSQPGMFHGQLQTHISSSKKVPSCCLKGLKTISRRVGHPDPTWHVWSQPWPISHWQKVFLQGPWDHIRVTYIYVYEDENHWRAYLCEKSILFADVHLTGYFWMRGWVHGRWMGSRWIPLWKRKWNKRMSSQNLMEKYLNEWHGRGLGNEDKEKEHGAWVEAACWVLIWPLSLLTAFILLFPQTLR